METIVQQIHRAFNTASSNILERVKNAKKAKQLLNLGFKQAKGVEDILMTSAYEEYAIKYPLFKFITHKDIDVICNKYNLVYAPVDRYKGDVPQKNIDEIEAFLEKMGDKVIHVGVRHYCPNACHNEELRDRFKKWCNLQPDTCSVEETYAKWVEMGGDANELSITKTVDFTAKDVLFICAPKQDMDLSGLVENGNTYHVPDPVVICKVPKGGLIVTAWGPEAVDVVNEKLN